MADRPTGQGPSIVGVGAAACVACCAPPVIGFLAAAGVGTILGVALFGGIGLAVLAAAIVIYLRGRAVPCATDGVTTTVAVSLGRKPDA